MIADPVIAFTYSTLDLFSCIQLCFTHLRLSNFDHPMDEHYDVNDAGEWIDDMDIELFETNLKMGQVFDLKNGPTTGA